MYSFNKIKNGIQGQMFLNKSNILISPFIYNSKLLHSCVCVFFQLQFTFSILHWFQLYNIVFRQPYSFNIVGSATDFEATKSATTCTRGRYFCRMSIFFFLFFLKLPVRIQGLWEISGSWEKVLDELPHHNGIFYLPTAPA